MYNSKKERTRIKLSEIGRQKNTQENLPKLDEIGAFDGDASLIKVCKDLLNFYKMESNDKVKILTDYLVKNDNFQKIKTEMDKKGSNRTQEDVDKFNAAVKDINESVNVYNKTNTDLNNNRNKLINDLNNAVESFMSKHIPRHK